ILQQQYVIANPDFHPVIPPISSLASAPQVIERIDSTLRPPYLMQSAFTIERQLPANTTLAVSYANSHGLHMLRSSSIRDPNSAAPVYLRTSSGVFNQNQLIMNVNSKVNAQVSLFGSYVLNRARSNSDGLNTFPANPAISAGEYGPASTDVH